MKILHTDLLAPSHRAEQQIENWGSGQLARTTPAQPLSPHWAPAPAPLTTVLLVTKAEAASTNKTMHTWRKQSWLRPGPASAWDGGSYCQHILWFPHSGGSKTSSREETSTASMYPCRHSEGSEASPRTEIAIPEAHLCTLGRGWAQLSSVALTPLALTQPEPRLIHKPALTLGYTLRREQG